uniref:Microfibril associated protein 4 n=1 Tax=Terrapene triunguis TaxID=2587831 RepID=A0A674K6N0_9SAUR
FDPSTGHIGEQGQGLANALSAGQLSRRCVRTNPFPLTVRMSTTRDRRRTNPEVLGGSPAPLPTGEICPQLAQPIDPLSIEVSGHKGRAAGPNPKPLPRVSDTVLSPSCLQVFQKRFNGSVSFFRGWNDYRFGFGRADSEYWLGLQNIHLLTLKRKYELRVDLEDFENNTAWAQYTDFSLSPQAISAEEDGYTLHVGGFTDGGAGDSLSYHTGQKFSTFDRDQDLYVQNCAALSSGAWWFKSCHFSNLNGFYLGGAHLSYANGLNWAQWKGFYYSLRKSEMKIRRI